MTQLNAICKAANGRIQAYNHLVRNQQSRSIELQTECALEVLAELADDLGALAMYQQITDRMHQLDKHRVLAPITVSEGGGVSTLKENPIADSLVLLQTLAVKLHTSKEFYAKSIKYARQSKEQEPHLEKACLEQAASWQNLICYYEKQIASLSNSINEIFHDLQQALDTAKLIAVANKALGDK